MVGAEKLQPASAQALEGKFGLAMLEGYGATEMSAVVSVNIPNREHAGVRQTGVRAGPVGQPVPRVAARVVDRVTGKILKHCEEGLLAYPYMFKGYQISISFENYDIKKRRASLNPEVGQCRICGVPTGPTGPPSPLPSSTTPSTTTSVDPKASAFCQFAVLATFKLLDKEPR
jgi:acyl-CoA synthetase (AMP-forming)/AMP-acid ligase II